ncbi:hypothetical protein [Aestuariivivens sediminis]|uniref:hypothetical protein n=1 Tax=Aestuariivivens sediminis TaxID=2913557 RepID=UPI001F5920C0|nr:hypothetical protein [Aestuariivivens sediminis]
MKSLKILALLLAVLVSSNIEASTDKTSRNTVKNAEPSNPISKEVVSHLKKPQFYLEEDVLVFVKFTLNDKNEMVVLSVDSENQLIDSFIKNRLNYKKLNARSNKRTKNFVIPVRVNAAR